MLIRDHSSVQKTGANSVELKSSKSSNVESWEAEKVLTTKSVE